MHVTMILATAAAALVAVRGAAAEPMRPSTLLAAQEQDKPDQTRPPAEAKPGDAPPSPPPADQVKNMDAPPPATPPEGKPPETTPPAGPEVPGGAAGEDVDAPAIAHTPVTHAPRGKSLRVEAQITDPAGVFQAVLWLRGAGMSDYLPLKFVADKITMGQYAVEVPTALMSRNLEYYIEAYDNLGNGPARAGSPERPMQIKIDEPVVVEKPPEKIIVPNRPKGAPPAITHSAVGKTLKGKSVEIAARLKGETGVSNAVVKFRQLGDSDWKTLPMGNIGGDSYTATIPTSQTGKDVEYYIEASDQYGNGPGRSGGPEVPYLLRAEDEPPPPPKIVLTEDLRRPKKRAEPPPFKANPGRAFGYVALAGALGSLSFALGNSYAAWQANENYQHTYKYEGRLSPAVLQRANDYGSNAKTFAIAGAAAAVVATVLLIVFPNHDEAPSASGSGGDGPVLFRF